MDPHTKTPAEQLLAELARAKAVFQLRADYVTGAASVVVQLRRG